jgi:hypothetical protein
MRIVLRTALLSLVLVTVGLAISPSLGAAQAADCFVCSSGGGQPGGGGGHCLWQGEGYFNCSECGSNCCVASGPGCIASPSLGEIRLRADGTVAWTSSWDDGAVGAPSDSYLGAGLLALSPLSGEGAVVISCDGLILRRTYDREVEERFRAQSRTLEL